MSLVCLVDQDSGLPHYKPTGFLTASRGVKKELSRRCSGLHQHQPLEGEESSGMDSSTMQGNVEWFDAGHEGENRHGSF